VIDHPGRIATHGVQPLRSHVSDEHHMALPHLYGGPAYSRPPRPVHEIPRPFDPDELPLEAERSDEDGAQADQLLGTAWTPTSAPPTKVKGSRRGRGVKPARSSAAGQATAGAIPPAGSANGTGGLQGRPFRLRGLGRIFRTDHK
jgi:hypothetical protein